jgi:hypothetical protein
MRARTSLPGPALLVAGAVSLTLAACGSGSSETTSPDHSTASTARSTAETDPLTGEWRTEFTCRESVRAIRQRLSAKQIRHNVGSVVQFVESTNGDYGWHAKPTADDPCHGVTGPAALIARFADGNLALCNADTGQCEVNATYEPIGARAIRINDEEGNLCPCPAKWQFELDGDRVTFHVAADPYIVAAWEAAPWVRGR